MVSMLIVPKLQKVLLAQFFTILPLRRTVEGVAFTRQCPLVFGGKGDQITEHVEISPHATHRKKRKHGC